MLHIKWFIICLTFFKSYSKNGVGAISYLILFDPYSKLITSMLRLLFSIFVKMFISPRTCTASVSILLISVIPWSNSCLPASKFRLLKIFRSVIEWRERMLFKGKTRVRFLVQLNQNFIKLVLTASISACHSVFKKTVWSLHRVL